MGAPNQQKIIWFLWGDPTYTASSRIHGLAVHRKLVALGYNSFIAYIPRQAEDIVPFSSAIADDLKKRIRPGDVIVFQKLKHADNLPLLQFLKRLQARLILIDCDWPPALDVGHAVNHVVCTSDLLRQHYVRAGVPASYIEDSPEVFLPARAIKPREVLTCVWFGEGSPDRWRDVEVLKEILSDHRLSRWRLVTVSNHPEATIQWKPNALHALTAGDVVALPVFDLSNQFAVKSANRMLQAMALSIPVVCSPLPAYEAVAAAGVGAVICDTREAWITALLALQDNTHRAALAAQAFETAGCYHLDQLIFSWIGTLGLTNDYKGMETIERKKSARQLQRLFYGELIKKNINYLLDSPISATSFAGAAAYFQRKCNRILRGWGARPSP